MGSTTKGDGGLKQVMISMVVVMLAAGILAGTVLYSVSVMRQVQLDILTGELAVADQTDTGSIIGCKSK